MEEGVTSLCYNLEMIKVCQRCLIEKEEDEFHWNRKYSLKRSSYCRGCSAKIDSDRWHKSANRRESNKAWIAKRTAENNEKILEYFRAHPCASCGEEDPLVLEFHHKNPDEKTSDISVLKKSSTEKLFAEIAKCDVLCANCHRRITARQYRWAKVAVMTLDNPVNL